MKTERNDDGVSTTMGYLFNIAIATTVIAVLLFAGQGTMDDVVGLAESTQMEVTGERVLSNLETADRLAREGGTGEIQVSPADVDYDVELDPDTDSVVLSADGQSTNLTYAGESSLPDDEFRSSQGVTIAYKADDNPDQRLSLK